MSEQSFREIQLSGKQLVFLFMTSVVVVVGVFLLGVSVGRGVRANTGGLESGAQTASVEPPADLPPPTEMTPADLAYHATLRGNGAPPSDPEADAVADEGEQVRAGQASTEPVMAPTFPEAPAAPAASDPPSTTAVAARPAPAAASDGWSVQVGAYRSKGNADAQVRLLVAKGYAAAALPPVVAGGLYRVRVGPFAQRAEAERTAARLKSAEGMNSSVTR